ncbi:hypothetical protein SEA_SQUIDDLY_101 [Gordonia phage Squiddly]|nr:hypothetical protein SEA_SQUIDDLY_101 [Gordonia phage Squiddly]
MTAPAHNASDTQAENNTR